MEEYEKSAYLKDIDYFAAKLEENPSSTLFVPLANAYIKMEQFNEAVRVLSFGIDANPEMYSAKTLLAQAYLGEGNIQEAKAILTEVQVVDRNNYLASKLMGDIHRNDDDIKKALVCYRNALMVAPEDTELRDLLEELMSAAGIGAHELEGEQSLIDADDELLDQLGSELAEEVRQDVGESELGAKEASDEEVSSTVDSIVGIAEEAEEEMPLDSYQEDFTDGITDELEEELVASFDDEVIPTALSPEEPADADADEPGAQEVKTMAAEIGADLGLDTGDTDNVSADEIDEALDSVFGSEDAVAEPEPELDDDLKAILGESDVPSADVPAESEPELDDDLRAILGESDVPSADTPAESEPELDDDLRAILGESDVPSADTPAEPEPELNDDLEAILGEPDVPSADASAESEPELDDDLKAILGEPDVPSAEAPVDSEPELDDDLEAILGEPDVPSADTPAEPESELDDDLEAILGEPDVPSADTPAEPESELDDDAEEILIDTDVAGEPEEVYEASMEELMDVAPESSDDEYADLDQKTREQVNRLENLLETIKNNAGS